MKSKRKVLLIGLGGTGCQVVSQVKKMIGNNDPSVQFLGFDTDTNQEKAPDLRIVKTSRDAKVYELLRSETDWQNWFPDDAMLMDEDMLEGAAQKRVLSRLAFADTIRRPSGLAEMKKVLQELNLEDGDLEDRKLKVMVVSSFAGGTGSGMFLQLPLFLRAYIQKHYHVKSIDFRGLFALPDIYVAVSNSPVQTESMYANAYASLKELSAINTICLSKNPETSKYNVVIEGLFDSKRISDKKKEKKAGSTYTAAGKKPYDFIFFVDNLNRNNKILESKDAYLQKMTEITYMQVYSPLASMTASREDNLFEVRMQSDGESMYGSAGTSKLVYPYEDILEYCAVRRTSDAISGKWTVFDKAYKRDFAEAKKRRATDPSVKLPVRGDCFIDEANQRFKDGNRNFAFLRDNVRVTGMTQDNASANPMDLIEAEQDRAVLFFEAIGDYIKSRNEGDEVLRAARVACDNLKKLEGMNPGKEEVYKDVKKSELGLEKYYKAIIERTDVMYTSIVDTVVPEAFADEADDANKPYHIRSLLENVNQGQRCAVHPLAARYMLYQLQKLLQQRKKELASSVKSYKARIDLYFNQDYDQKTRDKVEKIYDVVPKGWFGRSGYLKKYYDNRDTQLNALKLFASARLEEAALEGILARVSALILYYEKVFDVIDSVKQEMDGRAQMLEDKFDREHTCDTYVCASPAYMKKVYDGLMVADEDAGNDSLYNGLLAQVYAGAMEELAKRKENQNYTVKKDSYQDKLVSYSVSRIFREEVLPYYRQELERDSSDQLNMTVYQAVEAQIRFDLEEAARLENKVAEFTAADYAQARQNLLGSVARKAAPFLISNDYHEPNPLVAADTGEANTIDSLFWGINDVVAADISRDFGASSGYFNTTGTLTSDIKEDRAYSPYEFSCYRALYNVRLTEIPKFIEDEDDKGIFYEHYERRVNTMLSGRYNTPDQGCTPHLNIHWHTREYLPMISSAKDILDDQKAAKAMWLGLLYGGIVGEHNTKTAKKQVLVHFFRRRTGGLASEQLHKSKELLYNGKPLRISQTYEIFKGLQQDTLTTQWLLDTYMPYLEEDSTLTSENYNFRGAKAIPLALALIGDVKDEAPVEDVVVEEDFTFTTSRNVLEMMSAVVKHRQATDEEKQMIMSQLWEIIRTFTEQMSDDRIEELLRRIFNNSPYTNPVQRNGASVVLNPYFADAVRAYDSEKAASGKKTK